MFRRSRTRWLRRPALLTSARPGLARLEDRTVPSAVYFPPSNFVANSSLTTVGAKTGAHSPVDTSLSFLGQHAAEFGLTPADLADAIVTDQYIDADTGIAHVYLRQQVNGLPVINANFSVGIAANGAVISAGGGFLPGLATALATGVQWPKISAVGAVGYAAANLGLTPANDPTEVEPFNGPITKPLTSAVIDAKGVSLDAITAKLVYSPTADGSAAVSWELVIRTPDGRHWYDMTVDAQTGAVLSQADWVDSDTYNAVPVPNESPQDGGFQVVSNEADSVASPFGWHDTNGVAGAEFTDTRGNNVDVHLDRDGNNTADGTRPDGGTALDFSGYSFNSTLAPSDLQNENVAQVNLYNVINTLHDVHYQYGFTEAAGNFQGNNYGRGGTAGDAVQADAQDGGDTNNADFASPADGSAGRMQMYEWTSTTPRRDGDLDNGVITHEFGHGVSTRLTGGPSNSSSLDNAQSGGMGEGWSDFYALMFMQRPADTQNAGYGMGTYVIGQPQTGLGIRRYRYSFNMTTDPLTFDAYGTSGTTSYGTARSTEVHNTGEMWASTLWDMNWLLINKYGFDSDLATGWSAGPGPAHAGNKLALRLVMDGLKLQPANPSFTQARDAIIAADVALNGGNDLSEIWSAFARRGLGQGASVGASTATTTPTTSTTLPMLIASAGPATGSVVTSHPAGYTLTLSSPITSGLDASDLVVNGQAATNVSYTAGATTATFTFDTDPVTANGPQTVSIAANAFSGSPGSVSAYSSTFYVDPLPLTVTTVTPAAGATVAPQLTTVDVTLNQPIDPASVQANDLSISRGTVTGASLLNGNSTVRFTVANLNSEISFTVGLAAGAFLDLSGAPSAAFNGGTVTLEYGTQPFPTALQARPPVGSLTYDGSLSANVGVAGDTDSFTLTLAANQTLNVTVTPDAALRPSITVAGPGTNQTASATGAGSAAVLNSIPITTAGTYTLTVAGVSSTTGRYTLQPSLNIVGEAEANGGASNDATATAQSLTPAFLNLGGGLAVANVKGRSDAAPGGVVAEAEPNDTTAQANSGAVYSAAPANSVYQLGVTTASLSSTTDVDYYYLGTMQAGDVLTITAAATGSGRGTAADPLVALFRAGDTATPVATDDDSGAGLDALLYRFNVTIGDGYYVRVTRASSTAGTYQLGVTLENSGVAPNTGSTVTSEVEPNATSATATNLSAAWRAVNYTASAAGNRTSGDTDIYSYQFTAGDVVSLSIHASPSLTPRASLLNSSGTVVANDNVNGNNTGSSLATAGGQAAIFDYVIPSSETYYFRVTAGTSTGTYTADVNLSTTATLSTAPPGLDLYSVDLAAGQVASAVVKGATAGALHVALLDPTGAVVAPGVAGTTNVDEAVTNFVAPAAGTYFVRVTGTANVDYQLTVVTGGTFDAEANDTFATAQPLVVGTSALGAVSGNDDWYQVTLAVGNVLTLATATPGIGNGLDPVIELFDPNNTLVGSDDNSAADGRNATLTRTAAVAGNYRVRVTAAGSTGGEYVLKSTVSTPPATVAAVQVDDGRPQRSEVRSLTVTFSTAVAFANNDPAAAFTLTRVGGGQVGLVAGTPVLGADGRMAVTLTVTGTTATDPLSAQNGAALSLDDGRYQLSILDGTVTGANGLALDGDNDGTAGGTYQSPDDTAAGGPNQLGLYRLFGDGTGNGVVDLLDLGQLRGTFNSGTGNAAYVDYLDADANGVVDLVDLGQFRTRFNKTVF